jgi:hypothetical protein
MTKKRTAENEIVVSGATAAQTRRKTSARPRAKHAALPETPSTLAVGSEAAMEQIAVTPAVVVATAAASPEEIAKLAYLYWEARGCQGGSPEEDWLRAEQEVRARC